MTEKREVTIKFRDNEEGTVDISLDFNPPLKKGDDNTNAQMLASECFQFLRSKR